MSQEIDGVLVSDAAADWLLDLQRHSYLVFARGKPGELYAFTWRDDGRRHDLHFRFDALGRLQHWSEWISERARIDYGLRTLPDPETLPRPKWWRVVAQAARRV